MPDRRVACAVESLKNLEEKTKENELLNFEYFRSGELTILEYFEILPKEIRIDLMFHRSEIVIGKRDV